MTRHSTLTNPNDLHYAKVRAFAGNPDLITPDFTDQILTATDTNKVYRATGISQGGVVELCPLNSSIVVGLGYPPNAPSAIGEIYVDLESQAQFVAVNTTVSGWFERPFGTTFSLSISGISNTTPYYGFYTDTDPSVIESSNFSFPSEGSWGSSGSGSIYDFIFPYGRGAWVIVPQIDFTTHEFALSLPATGTSDGSLFEIRSSPHNIFIDDTNELNVFGIQSIGNQYLYIPTLSHKFGGVQVEINLQIDVTAL